MAELNTATIKDFVKLADVLWVESYNSIPQVMRNSSLFRIDVIPEGTGESREYSEIDLNEYAKKKDEGDQASRAKVQQGYSKTMEAVRYGDDISITVEMRKRNKYRDVITRLTNLGRLVPNRLDLDLSHRLTFATATTYVDMDGDTVSIDVGDDFQLAYTAHTLRGSSTTYRNRLAANPKISKGALEGMERLVTEQTYNQHGEKMTFPFDILWTTDDPNSVNTAREHLNATSDPDAANAGTVNVNRAKYRHLMLPRVATDANGAPDTTKRYYWGLASSMFTSAYLGVWEEPYLLSPVELGKDTSEDWDFGCRGSYGITIVSGAWLKFSTGDGTA